MVKRILMTALLALAATASVASGAMRVGIKQLGTKANAFLLLCLFSTAALAQSSVALTATPNPYEVSVGDTVPLTATVSGNSPTGTVAFYLAEFYGVEPALLDTVPLDGGAATLTQVFATAGSKNITAVYSGDAHNASAISPRLRLSVWKKPTLTNVTLSATTLQAGQALTVTATVTGDNPTGSIYFSFYIGNKAYGTSAPLTNGQATITAPSYATATVGTQSVRASYTADALNEVSNSNPVPYTVSAPSGNVLPTVSIAAPANNASFVGPADITVTAAAHDADGTIVKVEFFGGAALLATVTDAPYTYTWNVAWGMRSIMAVATDDQGAAAASAPVTITVTPNAPPTVSLSSPANDASFTAPAGITLTADAADSDGSIHQVAFYAGDVFIGSTTSAPYTLSWPDVPAGSYTVTAVATDNHGRSTTSAPVAVTVAAASGSATQIYYVHADHLDTPRVITDSSNNVVWEWDNTDPFGNNIPVSNGVEFNLRFPGQYFDTETGLHYNYFRTYDPSTGRYVQSDPIGLDGGINTFAYALGNPLTYVDPLGLAVKCKTVLKLPGFDIQRCDVDETTPSEQDAKDAKRMSGKELDRACKNNGYKDAHDLKKDLGLDSKSDIFADSNGNMYSGPRQGTGTPQYLHMNIKGWKPQ